VGHGLGTADPAQGESRGLPHLRVLVASQDLAERRDRAFVGQRAQALGRGPAHAVVPVREGLDEGAERAFVLEIPQGLHERHTHVVGAVGLVQEHGQRGHGRGVSHLAEGPCGSGHDAAVGIEESLDERLDPGPPFPFAECRRGPRAHVGVHVLERLEQGLSRFGVAGLAEGPDRGHPRLDGVIVQEREQLRGNTLDL